MRLLVIEGEKQKQAFIDGETSAVVDTLRGVAKMLESETSRAVGVGIVVTFNDGTAATIFDEGGNPFQLMGACDELKARIRRMLRVKK